MNIDLSNISTIVTVFATLYGIYQKIIRDSERSTTKTLLGSWQNQAAGIKNALLGIGQNPNNFSDKKDIAAAVTSVAQSAVSLDQAMVENRFYTDKEIKSKREDGERETKEFLANMRKQQFQNGG